MDTSGDPVARRRAVKLQQQRDRRAKMTEQNKALVRATERKRKADKVQSLSAVEEAAFRERERLRTQAWRDGLSAHESAMLTARNTLQHAGRRQQLAGQDMLDYRERQKQHDRTYREKLATTLLNSPGCSMSESPQPVWMHDDDPALCDTATTHVDDYDPMDPCNF
jgi:hypothetical protein